MIMSVGGAMEGWIPLRDYPGYSGNGLGQIRNDKRDRILSNVVSQSGHVYVGLIYNGVQVKRSVAKLITEAFLPTPKQRHFTTPIHLNGELSDCHVSNLLLRPRWFAMRFTQQFKRPQPEHAPVRNKLTGMVYQDCWPLVMGFGLLYLDIVLSATNMTYVFPTMQMFEWVI
jgi:hypothetical protein